MGALEAGGADVGSAPKGAAETSDAVSPKRSFVGAVANGWGRWSGGSDCRADKRSAIRHPQPLHIDAWVVLPDHMHCIWTLPPDDDKYSGRWRAIKKSFSKAIPPTERRSAVRQQRGERGIWQRRFWEHTIRDDADYASHMDYVHFNPVKHSVGRTCRGLAVFVIPPRRRTRALSHRLGHRDVRAIRSRRAALRLALADGATLIRPAPASPAW